MRLDAGGVDLAEAMAGGPALGRALQEHKGASCASVPDNGLGYGLLRYLNGETGAELAEFALPQIAFNCLGRFAAPGTADWARAAEGDALGGGGDPALALSHVLEVNALTLDGADGATLSAELAVGAGAAERGRGRRSGAELGSKRWKRWCGTRRRRARAGAARPICRWLRSRRARSSGWRGHYPQIEDILPLSPLQEGLLFHALYDAQAPDVYATQTRARSRRAAGWRRDGVRGARAGGAAREPADGLPA